MVSTRRAAAERARAAAMAFSKLSGDEQGVILGQLRNTLEPRLVMYFSSASKELRALLPPAARQQLRADYEEATALCLKVGMRDCKELREATEVDWWEQGPYCSRPGDAGQAGLGAASARGAVPRRMLRLSRPRRRAAAGGGAGRGRAAGRDLLDIFGMHVGDAGASALAAALDRGALPRLESLALGNAAIGDAALAALAPALRRRPALEDLYLYDNPFGDEGLAALVAPPPPAGTPPPPAGGLKKLKRLDLRGTQITDAGCATLAAALDSGALPALEQLELDDIPASAAAKEAVDAALARSRSRAAPT